MAASTRARSLIDFATLTIGFGALLWFTALEPLATMSFAQLAENWALAGYGIGNAMALVAGAMVAMQITDWRSERAAGVAAHRHGGDAGGGPAVGQCRAAR